MTDDTKTIDVVIDEDDAAAPALTPTDVDEGDEKILPDGAVLNADRSVTLQLKTPVTLTIRSAQGAVRSETHAELTLHRLTGADLNAVNATAAEHQQLVLFTRSTRIKSSVMRVLYDRLDGADIVRCGKVLNSFL